MKYVTKFSRKISICLCVFYNFSRNIWEKHFCNKNSEKYHKRLFFDLFWIQNNLKIFIVQFNIYIILFRIQVYSRWESRKCFEEQISLFKVHSKLSLSVSFKFFDFERYHHESWKDLKNIEYQIFHFLLTRKIYL